MVSRKDLKMANPKMANEKRKGRTAKANREFSRKINLM